jgi:entericidin B
MATVPGAARPVSESVIMSQFFKVVFMAAVLLSSAAVLSACNTVAGAGEDVSSAGHAVSNTAEKAK